MTFVVVTVKFAVVLPAGTVTLAGTVADALLLDNATATSAGAAPFSVTVPVVDVPPATAAGLSATDASAAGLIVSDAVIFEKLYPAVITAFVAVLTALVVTVKAAVELPAGTVTLAATVANELLLDNATEMPPAGATAVRNTVPVDEVPPPTMPGLSETKDNAGTGVMVSEAVWFTPI